LVLPAEAEMSEAIVVQNVTKKFGSPYRPSSRWIPAAGLPGYSLIGSAQPAFSALEDVTFQVLVGEIFALVGPHGSGKTTLVQLLGGLLPPDKGIMRVFGYDVVRQPAQARAMTNRISGQASFFQRLSAVENLAYSAHQAGLSRPEACKRAAELLTQLGTQPHEMKLPLVAVSRSMYQKVALANALLSRPRLLLLDEPFHGMDRSDRQRAQRLLRVFSEQDGITILFATRDTAEARAFSDRLVQMENGRILGEERPEIQDSQQNGLLPQPDWTGMIPDTFPHNKVQQEEFVR
jgi:ABC-2 type transport system ATP-binding protein